MEIMQVLHMNKGEGEASYAKNSILQRNIMSIANSLIKEAVLGILSNNFPESIGIADLGYSSGPNTLILISQIIDIVHATGSRLGRPLPEFRVSLNDLPSNDFNTIFESLPEFYKKLKEEKGGGLDRCFISGVPGSFYGRLFPSNSIHFVHSSSSLHRLSQVPPALDSKAEGKPINKGNIYISKTSPICVVEAYLSQYKEDFTLFLKSRAEEMVPGGRMVLSLLARSSADPTTDDCNYQWALLSQVLLSMASEGLIEKEKIDSFNAPYYAPYPEELKSVVETQGSFIVDRLEAVEVDWFGDISSWSNGSIVVEQHQMIKTTEFEKRLSSGQRFAKTIRAVAESMLEFHFGREIMDELFRRYSEIVDDHLSKNRAKYVDLVVSLIRKS